jgi:hypothetical protein
LISEKWIQEILLSSTTKAKNGVLPGSEAIKRPKSIMRRRQPSMIYGKVGLFHHTHPVTRDESILLTLRYHRCLLFLARFRQCQSLLCFTESVHTNQLIFVRSARTLVDKCPGVPLIWDADDPMAIFSTYPWTRHAFRDNKMDFMFPTANYEHGEIVGFDIRSTSCAGFLDEDQPCLYCRRLTSKVNNLRKISKQAAGRLNYSYQTHEQLTHGHRLKNQLIKDLQLSVRHCFRFKIPL